MKRKKFKLPPYIRDVYLAYIIRGARLTKEGYPIIEKWMVSREIPSSISQWNCRSKIKDPSKTAISFYCNDQYFQPVISNPNKYIEKLSIYQMVIGMDASPFDNMPLVVQQSQIYVNLALTYYYGRQGLKIVPNIRLGLDKTIDSLEAYPCGTLIAIGTNGFVNDKLNLSNFANQIKIIVNKLNPSGIIVYGTTPNIIFEYPKRLNIPIYAFESFIHQRRTHANER